MTVILEYSYLSYKFSNCSIKVYRSQVVSTSVKQGCPGPCGPPVPMPMLIAINTPPPQDGQSL